MTKVTLSVAAVGVGACATVMVASLGFACLRIVKAPPPNVKLADYATSLVGRTVNQRYNAKRAADLLNGAEIAPGGVFSFNKRVKSWSADRGFVKAPVSYEGELVRAFGGGVCQTSTTLYNAALLAGLDIVERHHHEFAAHYVAPGLDAAVAQYNIDLQVRNPYPWALRINASAMNDQLRVSITGAKQPSQRVAIITRILDRTQPNRLTRVMYRPLGSVGKSYVRSPGMPGYRVVTYRVFTQGGREVRRERLSDDSYPAMNRVIAVTEEARL